MLGFAIYKESQRCIGEIVFLDELKVESICISCVGGGAEYANERDGDTKNYNFMLLV